MRGSQEIYTRCQGLHSRQAAFGPYHIDSTTKAFFHRELWAVANGGLSGGGIVAHMAGLASRVHAYVSLWEQLAHIRFGIA